MGDFLKRNLSALREVDAGLARAVGDAEVPSDWEVAESKAGPVTLRVTTADGRRVFLHSRYDPREEARRILSKYDLGGAFTYIVFGFGLGYHVLEMLEHSSAEPAAAKQVGRSVAVALGRRRVRRVKAAASAKANGRDLMAIVIEKDARVLKLALRKADFSGLIREGKLIVLLAPTKAGLMQRLQGLTVRIFSGVRLISHPGSVQTDRDFYAEQAANVLEFIEYANMSLKTAMLIPIETRANLLMNLPGYVYQPGLEVLKGRFKGYPAILVTAGPSLAKNIEQLAGLRSRAVIIAVGTIYKTLLSHGVVPHFVTTLDYHRISGRYLEGVADYGGSVLVAEPKASYEAVDAFEGRKLFCGNEFLDSCLEGLGVKRAWIKGSATVAHLAFFLADYVGAEPIILVGQDLSFPHGVTHIPGSAIHKSWYPELNRFNTMEMKEWDALLRMRGRQGQWEGSEGGSSPRETLLRKVKDIFGNEIYTDVQMYSYLLHFEREFAQTPTKVIDATEGGVRKAGAEPMKLREAAERFCAKEMPEELFEIDMRDFFTGAPTEEAVVRHLRGQIEEVIEVRGLYQEALGVLNEIKEKFKERGEVKRLMGRVQALRERINDKRRIGEQIAEISQKAEFRKRRRDLEIAGKGLEGLEKQGRQLARDIDYLNDLLTASRLLERMLKECIRRMEEFDVDEVKRLWGLKGECG